jgi:hypothetical protein
MSAADRPDRSSAFTSGSVPDEYERHLVPVVFAPWAEILLDAVEVSPGSRVLDIASGTGVVARAAARRTGGDGHPLEPFGVYGDELAGRGVRRGGGPRDSVRTAGPRALPRSAQPV